MIDEDEVAELRQQVQHDKRKALNEQLDAQDPEKEPEEQAPAEPLRTHE